MHALIITMVLVVATLGGYFLIANKLPFNIPNTNTSRSFAQPTKQPIYQPPVREVAVSLNEENDSKQYGTAMLKEEGGKIMVMIDLNGAPEGIKQPAHIHLGNCPEVGEVKYPLTSLENGKSETMLNLTFDELKKYLPLAINVHKSETEGKIYTACGNLFSE